MPKPSQTMAKPVKTRFQPAPRRMAMVQVGCSLAGFTVGQPALSQLFPVL
jgi:hypothetical protein